jgi:hypothetical protein
MSHEPEFSKSPELRAKTDRQLVLLLSKTLSRALRLAREGAETDEPELYARAHEAYAEVLRLLPYVAAAAERRRMENELVRLGRLLEQAAVSGDRACAACC